jgi:hypothetical protein
MDYNFIMFLIITFLLLCGVMYLEVNHKTKREERRSKAKAEELDKYIKAQRELKDKKKEAAIDYLTRFKLEYDPDTHTYIKVEELRPDEIDIIKIN